VLLKVPSGEVPYPLFAYTALLPWSYFASSLAKSSTSIVTNTNLVTKVYFPRMVIPLSSVLSGVIDLGVAFVILVPLMLVYGYKPSLSILVLPVFVLLAMLTAFGFGLWFSALNVRFRDVNYLMPFLIQVWMYATPVIYSSNLIPAPFRWLLALNPMTGVVEGFRWAVLGTPMQDTFTTWNTLLISVLISFLVFLGGLVFFRRTERSFADIL
jgi:lipopolysaccharide transport system permease protein